MDFYNHKLTKSDASSVLLPPVGFVWKMPEYKSILDKYATVVNLMTRNATSASFHEYHSMCFFNLEDDYTAPQTMTGDDNPPVTIEIDGARNVAVGDRLVCFDTRGYESDGRTLSDKQLMLIVTNIDDANQGYIDVKAVNGKTISNVKNCVPSLSTDDDNVLALVGRDGVGLDPVSYMYQSPFYFKNYCQNFTQIVSAEKSGIQTLNEKGYAFSMKDMVKMAKSDFKFKRDLAFMFSACDDTYQTTNGLWYGVNRTQRYSTDTGFETFLGDLIKQSFYNVYTPINKILLSGISLFEWILSKGDITLDDDSTCTLKTYAGPIKVIPSELFEPDSHSYNGLMFPEDGLVKYVYQPYTEVYSKDGLTCTISECAAMGLKVPQQAIRIIKR